MRGRVLGIDYGDKRVGIAWSDPLGIAAHPQPFLCNSALLIDEIKQIIVTYNIQKVIVGVPKNRKGEPTQQTGKVMQFMDRLKKSLTIPIETINEGYSTKAASQQLHECGKSTRVQRGLIDSQSAAFFLQGYLDR
jgi:putative Holliday junction resolvase